MLRYRLVIFFALIWLAFASVNILATSDSQAGNLVSTVAYVDEQEQQTLGYASGVTIELEYKGRIVKLVSDEQGDYIVSLAKGKYCLKSAVTADNRALRFSPSQHRCFKIQSGRSTRFDVMLLKP